MGMPSPARTRSTTSQSFYYPNPTPLHVFTPVHDGASFMSFPSFAISPARAKGYNYITKRRFVSRSSVALVKHVFPLSNLQAEQATGP